MRDRLHEMVEIVQENMKQAQKRQKRYYDRGARGRDLEEGDQVLVLLPTRTNKLKLEWVGDQEGYQSRLRGGNPRKTSREKGVSHQPAEEVELGPGEGNACGGGAEGPEAGGLYLWGSEVQMTMDEIETPAEERRWRS